MWECIRYAEQRCDEVERKSICLKMGQLLGVDYQEIEDDRIVSLMTEREISELFQKGFDIQLHTHRHYLSSDDELLIEKEITEGVEFAINSPEPSIDSIMKYVYAEGAN